MIESITLVNFQKHARLAVDLGAPITTVTGPTDAGKSSLLRAIQWVATNTPQGDGFIRAGEKACICTMQVDGRTVVRERHRNGENIYRLDDKEFRAFGNTVPKDIEQFLNVSPRCFQGQHDPAFFFSMTAGEVSRQLNSVVDLEVIDETLAAVAGRVRAAQAKVGSAETDLREKNANAESTAWVVQAEEEYTVVEKLTEDATRVAAKLAVLAECVRCAADATQTMQTAADGVAATKAVGVLAAAALKMQSYSEEYSKLLEETRASWAKVDRGVPLFLDVTDTYNLSERLREQVVGLAAGIDRAAAAKRQTSVGVPPEPLFDELFEKEKQARSAVAGLGILLEQSGFASRAVARAGVEYYEAEKEFSEYSGGTCPLCGKAEEQ